MGFFTAIHKVGNSFPYTGVLTFFDINFRPNILPKLSCPTASRCTWEYTELCKHKWETVSDHKKIF